MTEGPPRARLLNAEGELIAEGPCHVDEAAGQATLEPERMAGVLQKERGELALELESGRSFRVSDRPMIIRFRLPGGSPGENGRRRVYRLRLLNHAQEVLPKGRTAGAAGEGAPAAPSTGRPSPGAEETPAAP